MTIIGKTFTTIAYHHGDYMWPFFKWGTIVTFVSILSLFLYSYFVIYPEYQTAQPDNLFILGCVELAKILNEYALLWIIIPFGVSLTVGFIFAGIMLEITRWFIKSMIADWFN